jgi:hypothetical protein
MTIWVWSSGNPCSWESKTFASDPLEIWGDGETLFKKYYYSPCEQWTAAGIFGDWVEDNLPDCPVRRRLLIHLRKMFDTGVCFQDVPLAKVNK